MRKSTNAASQHPHAPAAPRAINGRTTQVFIDTRDNSPTHDKQPFVPIGKVVEGMDVADKLYLERNFPTLDWIRRATVLEP